MSQSWTWADEVEEINRTWRLKWAASHPGCPEPQWSDLIQRDWIAGLHHPVRVYVYDVFSALVEWVPPTP